jgi:hypothetical protein
MKRKLKKRSGCTFSFSLSDISTDILVPMIAAAITATKTLAHPTLKDLSLAFVAEIKDRIENRRSRIFFLKLGRLEKTELMTGIIAFGNIARNPVVEHEAAVLLIGVAQAMCEELAARDEGPASSAPKEERIN